MGDTPKAEPICLTTLMTLCDDVSNDLLKLEAANIFIGPAIIPNPIYYLIILCITNLKNLIFSFYLKDYS